MLKEGTSAGRQKEWCTGAWVEGLRSRYREEGEGLYNFTTVKWKVNRTPVVLIRANPEAVLFNIWEIEGKDVSDCFQDTHYSLPSRPLLCALSLFSLLLNRTGFIHSQCLHFLRALRTFIPHLSRI